MANMETNRMYVTKKLVLTQMQKYPNCQPRDIYKALYQSEFGGGHFILSRRHALDLLNLEIEHLADRGRMIEWLEPIGMLFSRIHLDCIKQLGLSVQTLFQLFLLSSRYSSGDKDAFWRKLLYVYELCKTGELPFDTTDVMRQLEHLKREDFPSVHHTEAFKQSYHPAYRVIRKEYVHLIPLLAEIDQLIIKKNKVIVAIDGNCTAGKSTLADFFNKLYDCNVFHMDDFFLRPNQRTEARLQESGGNADYERFKSEVLAPLVRDEVVHYRPYDCRAQVLLETIHVSSKKLNIVEGSYSMHPTLSDSYDLSIFLAVDQKKQEERLINRNGVTMTKRFLSEWIPMENQYFKAINIANRCQYNFSELAFPAEVSD